MKYLHIGFPKTASTLFQNYVFNKADELNFIGVSFEIESPQAKDLALTFASWIHSSYSQTKRDISGLNLSNIDERILSGSQSNLELKKIIHHIKEMEDGRPLLISNEKFLDISRVACVPVDDMVKGLNEAFFDYKIIVTIREQSSFLEALYFENKKHRALNNLPVLSFWEWWEVAKAENYDLYLNYGNLLEALESFFGEENVYIQVFEEFKYDKVEFMSGLMRFIKLDKYSLSATLELPSVNSRYSKLGLWRAKLQKKMEGNKDYDKLSVVKKALKLCKPAYNFLDSRLKKEALSQKDLAKIRAMYMESNKRLFSAVPKAKKYWLNKP